MSFYARSDQTVLLDEHVFQPMNQHHSVSRTNAVDLDLLPSLPFSYPTFHPPSLHPSYPSYYLRLTLTLPTSYIPLTLPSSYIPLTLSLPYSYPPITLMLPLRNINAISMHRPRCCVRPRKLHGRRAHGITIKDVEIFYTVLCYLSRNHSRQTSS